MSQQYFQPETPIYFALFVHVDNLLLILHPLSSFVGIKKIVFLHLSLSLINISQYITSYNHMDLPFLISIYEPLYSQSQYRFVSHLKLH